MSVRPKNADGTPNAIYGKSPVFQHFTDRTIVKLDYNEGDKFSSGDAAHAGTFMRPERILASRKPVLGQIYRFQTRASADDISAGAVTEALANDLTRLAGVPSQELEIVRGQYSDGHPKLMLAAKFAKGYSDLENGMLKDGRAVPPTNPDGSKGPEPEPLGKYKAFFLVTADRDGVGSRGQNKGFINGKFFAIDPGHSLEGNGKYLKISDDLSFKDTYGKSTKPRFNNFSIFDDDTRFAKLQGVLELRELQNSGKFKQLFDDYRAAFNPNAPVLSDAEKALRTKVIAEIDKKQGEFDESLNRLLRTTGMQLELYDDLAADGPAMQQGAIETLSNLEKLFSPTTWVSKKGQVALKHLEVLPDSRVPWRGGVEGDNIVFFCDKPLDPDARSFLKSMMASAPGAELSTDRAGVTRLVVPKSSAERFFAACSEEKVMQLTHPEEYQARMEGGDGLREARTYQPVTTPSINNSPGKPLDANSLPDNLDLNLEDGTHIQFQRVHYEDMVTHTPMAERPRSALELRDFLAARIRLGNDIIKALLRGKTSRYEAKLENVTAVTLAFHAAALKKNEFIYRGSFSISDPNGTIARWLDTTPDLYQRTSTHARPYQSMQVDGHLNMPRGYDVPEGKNGLLNGMRTFHYFTIPDTKRLNDVDKGNGPRRRLFLKCETYGVFVNTIHAKFAAKAGSRTAEMQTRGYQFGDLCESIAHGASLLVSKFTSKTKGGIRKENLPPQIATAMYDAARDVRQAGFPLLADRLLDGGVMEGGGVRRFVDNANKLLAELPSEDARRLFELLEPKLTQIDAQLNTLNGVVDERMGNEVMLEPDDFLENA